MSLRGLAENYPYRAWFSDMQHSLSHSGQRELVYAKNPAAPRKATLAAAPQGDLRGQSEREGDSELFRCFQGLHSKVKRGDQLAAQGAFALLPDWGRLRYALYLWTVLRQGKIDAAIWARALEFAWKRGHTGCLLLKAELRSGLVVEMFRNAEAAILMSEEGEYPRYRALPEEIEVWRGATRGARWAERGMSWTLNRDQAEWFAHKNSREGEPVLLHARVAKSRILAAFNYEWEVVIDSRGSMHKATAQVLPRRTQSQIRRLGRTPFMVTLPSLMIPSSE